jgi:hypothetical protein
MTKSKSPEYIGTTESLDIIKKSWLVECFKPNLQTLIHWIKRYKLGFKFAGRWQIDKARLEDFIKKDILNGNAKKRKQKQIID